MVREFLETYYETRKNKRRSKDSVEFEMHFERNILRLVQELTDHTYTPSSYTFIVDHPRPREVFACDMSLRLIDHYLDARLRWPLESELTDRTFNNRIGYGGIEAINTLISDIYDVTRGFAKDAWIIKMDLKGYFPNADQGIVYGQLISLVERLYHGDDIDLVKYLIMISVFSNPTKDCRRVSPLWAWDDYPKEKSLFTKPDGIGGVIGRLLWQICMNYYINDIDHYVVDDCGLHYCRFVDDIAIVTDDKEACLALIPTIRQMLADKGCTLHPKKFYCQHYTKGVEFIGATIKRDRVYVNRRTVRNAFDHLREFNRHPRVRNLEGFMCSMNSYLGIFKGRNAHRITQRFIASVDSRWWRWCHYNKERQCIQANDGCTHRELVLKRYGINLKVKRHDNKRKNQRPRG